MEFENQYLTYSEYTMLGGTLEEMPFNLLELEARKNVNRETLGRLNNFTSIPMSVKTCIYELIELMAFDGNYKDVNSIEKQNCINRVIYNSLTGVVENNIALLYRGNAS